MSCRNCYTGRPGKVYWVLTYEFRPGKELTGLLADTYSPGVARACDACIDRIPKADRRKVPGRIGVRSGRVVALERCKVTYVGGHRARNETEQIGPTVYLSAATMRRFLPHLLAYMIHSDRVRMDRAKEEAT